jgi:hypothetical protein
MRIVPILVLSLGSVACGVRELPPVAAPAAEIPAVQDAPTTAPLPTNSRVTFDANGEPARVLEVTGEMRGFGYVGRHTTSMSAIMTKTVCGAAPCVADLPKGDHEILFVREDGTPIQESVDVKVGDAPKVVRHAFGRVDVSPAYAVGIVSSTLGVMTLAFSWMPFLFAGFPGRSQDSHDSLVAAGDGMLIGGAIALVGGIITAIIARPQHSPGSDTQWDLPNVQPTNPSPIQPTQGGVQF